MAEKMYNLQIVEANHADNAFYTLGGAGWRTEAERQANLDAIPTYEHDCDNDDRCYILDILDPDDGWSIAGDREISAETARALLGVDDFDALRDAEKEMLAALVTGSVDPSPCAGCGGDGVQIDDDPESTRQIVSTCGECLGSGSGDPS